MCFANRLYREENPVGIFDIFAALNIAIRSALGYGLEDFLCPAFTIN